ncbi:hypothetical protein [Phycicoccus sonneratiae]|uniref:Uncharacterized protein n=1 Tax=Phycicoccus sonneratiae TaxID=2807628 RepID=A0ABS2CHZ1_9MICO|nr:hypothetical protein [Phycicoccus sonneraticus]MBM6399486.1 hypothetical protein [Phycicoccus sonneraticus]
MVAPTGTGGRWRRPDLLLDLWVLLPAAVLAWPLLTRSGYPVARDLLFTPALPLRPEALGVGTGTPRAAPLDAVVAVLSLGVDGAVLGRVAVLAPLLLAGWGAHRLARPLGLPARALVAAFAVWNPFVVERLGLGQWALVLGYAVLWWVALALRPGHDRPLARLAPWLALGALTPTSAVLVGGTALVLGAAPRGTPGRRRAGLLGLVAAVQLPWLLPALLGGAGGTSDPAGVAAFAARAELPGPAVLSLLGLGGIWDRLSVPGTRAGGLGAVTVVLVVAGLVAVVRRPALAPRPLLGLGLAGLLLAAVTTVPWGADLVAAGTDVVPGLGLLRDGQKWLAPFVVVAVLGVGALADAGVTAARRQAPALAPTAVGACLLVPFVLLPDATVVVHRVLTPVTWPADFAAVARAVDGSDGVLASAPWRLYRRYPWAGAYGTYDPASRWFDVQVVTTDALAVGDRTVRGEDRLAARVGSVLAEPGAGTAAGLAAAGVRWVLVTRTDADASPLLAALEAAPSARRVHDGPDLVLVELADPAPVPRTAGWRVGVVAGTDLAVLALLLVVSLSRVRRRRP